MIGRPSDLQTNLKSRRGGIDTYAIFTNYKEGIRIEPGSFVLQFRFPIGYPLQGEPIFGELGSWGILLEDIDERCATGRVPYCAKWISVAIGSMIASLDLD